ncbi:hypothetical protein B0H16DRAFT_1457546 [Mycena metata]|uniref:Uncharacterized protein n=1 Tax=Mycena metata TaxID=1033252 RepID=A0AAD7NFR3_9AGAR|nr:hypothetical protein B0H16DRAFT_1457546 [Mycena metata]
MELELGPTWKRSSIKNETEKMERRKKGLIQHLLDGALGDQRGKWAGDHPTELDPSNSATRGYVGGAQVGEQPAIVASGHGWRERVSLRTIERLHGPRRVEYSHSVSLALQWCSLAHPASPSQGRRHPDEPAHVLRRCTHTPSTPKVCTAPSPATPTPPAGATQQHPYATPARHPGGARSSTKRAPHTPRTPPLGSTRPHEQNADRSKGSVKVDAHCAAAPRDREYRRESSPPDTPPAGVMQHLRHRLGILRRLDEAARTRTARATDRPHLRSTMRHASATFRLHCQETIDSSAIYRAAPIVGPTLAQLPANRAIRPRRRPHPADPDPRPSSTRAGNPCTPALATSTSPICAHSRCAPDHDAHRPRPGKHGSPRRPSSSTSYTTLARPPRSPTTHADARSPAINDRSRWGRSAASTSVRREMWRGRGTEQAGQEGMYQREFIVEVERMKRGREEWTVGDDAVKGDVLRLHNPREWDVEAAAPNGEEEVTTTRKGEEEDMDTYTYICFVLPWEPLEGQTVAFWARGVVFASWWRGTGRGCGREGASARWTPERIDDDVEVKTGGMAIWAWRRISVSSRRRMTIGRRGRGEGTSFTPPKRGRDDCKGPEKEDVGRHVLSLHGLLVRRARSLSALSHIWLHREADLTAGAGTWRD